jgi:hypothetical protein
MKLASIINASTNSTSNDLAIATVFADALLLNVSTAYNSIFPAMSLSASPANTLTSEVFAGLTLMTISKSPFQSRLKSAYLCVTQLVRAVKFEL